MNDSVMRFQTRKLQKMLADCNHHVINGFHLAKGDPDQSIATRFKGPFYEHAQFEYLANNKINYYGIDDSIHHLSDIIIKKDIDGIIGFSQGSYIGSILTNEIPDKLKFFVSICGMKCTDKNYKFDSNIPSFHIVGEKDDEWYQKGIDFYNEYQNAILHKHKDGHTFPTEKRSYQELVDWMKSLD